MAQITVVFDDKCIVKDGVGLHYEGDDVAIFDALVTAQGDTGLHAIQWDGSTGHCEYKDKSPQTSITAEKANAYSTAYDEEIERIKQARRTLFLAQDAQAWGRENRDILIAETDWWAGSDHTMTQAQIDYRQALRDLPSTDNWNPTLTWDDDTWEGSLTGITWPTKP